MIDKALDRLARVIEVVLALAFIVAVLLNFTNVVGRYLFGLSCSAPTRCRSSSWWR
jgi:TRAP-type C4-dicarboxylate transport system permease small subunit